MRYLRGRGDLEEPLVADDAGRPVRTPFEEAAASAALDRRMARLSRALLVVGEHPVRGSTPLPRRSAPSVSLSSLSALPSLAKIGCSPASASLWGSRKRRNSG